MASSQVPGDCYIDMVNGVGPLGPGTGYNDRMGALAIEFAKLQPEDREFLRMMLAPEDTTVKHTLGPHHSSPVTPTVPTAGRAARDSILVLPQDRSGHGNGFMPPKFAMFAGDGQKGEVSYAQWRSEVMSTLRAGIYQEGMIVVNMRRSLRGRAAEVLLSMGDSVSVREVVDKFDVRFGDILPTDVTLEQFFSAKQRPMESMSSWACRLEELLGKIREPASLTAARGMLRSRFWTGIQSGQIKNALRHHFDQGASFEELVKQSRVVENDGSVVVNSSQAALVVEKGPIEEKLDMLIKEMKSLNTRVGNLEKKYSQLSMSSGMAPVPVQAPNPMSNMVSRGPECSNQSVHIPPVGHSASVSAQRRFTGKCYGCGQLGHKHNDPWCPRNRSVVTAAAVQLPEQPQMYTPSSAVQVETRQGNA